MMKIAHVIWSLKAGGSEAMLVDIANHQALSDDITIIIGSSIVDQIVLKGLSDRVKIRIMGRPAGSCNPWYLLKVLYALRILKPDIVHAHQESFIAILRFLCFRKVLTVHDTNLSPQLAHKYDAVYTISDAVRNVLTRKNPDALSTVISNGSCFSAVKVKTSYGHLPFRIVQIGRLQHEIKGQDILLNAMKYLIDIIRKGHVLIDFVGEGPSLEFLEGLSEELGMAKWCRFIGRQSRGMIYDNLHTYDLLVQPSRYEGFGLTVVEAMAARVPVLVSNIEGPMEIIAGGEYGYFFKAGDYADCSEQVINVMKNSQEVNFPEKLRRNAEYAKSRFDIANTAK